MMKGNTFNLRSHIEEFSQRRRLWAEDDCSK